jgi:hypothetical protein
VNENFFETFLLAKYTISVAMKYFLFSVLVFIDVAGFTNNDIFKVKTSRCVLAYLDIALCSRIIRHPVVFSCN